MTKFFEGSSSARSSAIPVHHNITGLYCLADTAKGSRARCFFLASHATQDDHEDKVIVATVSNKAADSRLVVVPKDKVVGCVLHIITQDEAARLPKGYPKGKEFMDKTVKTKNLTSHLPSKTTTYVIVRSPTTTPIMPGTTTIIKGELTDSMRQHSTAISEYHGAWLTILSGGSPGMVPYTASDAPSKTQSTELLL